LILKQKNRRHVQIVELLGISEVR